MLVECGKERLGELGFLPICMVGGHSSKLVPPYYHKAGVIKCGAYVFTRHEIATQAAETDWLRELGVEIVAFRQVADNPGDNRARFGKGLGPKTLFYGARH